MPQEHPGAHRDLARLLDRGRMPALRREAPLPAGGDLLRAPVAGIAGRSWAQPRSAVNDGSDEAGDRARRKRAEQGNGRAKTDDRPIRLHIGDCRRDYCGSAPSKRPGRQPPIATADIGCYRQYWAGKDDYGKDRALAHG